MNFIDINTLIERINALSLDNNYPNLKIKDITLDSTSIVNNSLFVAISSSLEMNKKNIQEAIRNGAKVIITNKTICSELKVLYKNIVFINHFEPKLALSKAAPLFYPNQPNILIAITGTNGKSSSVNFVKQIWEYHNYLSASIGTLGINVSTLSNSTDNNSINRELNKIKYSQLTTPDALSIHKILNIFSNYNINHCAFEASSHGLDQYRLHGTSLSAAGWTNITQDHLDYHSSIKNYFLAKLKLISEILPKGKALILSKSTNFFKEIYSESKKKNHEIITYGIDDKSDIEARLISTSHKSSYFNLIINGKEYGDHIINIPGLFQVENLLCALGILISTGLYIEKAVEAIPFLKEIPGRMEYIGKTKLGALVYIDYAHTPDALKSALIFLKRIVYNKKIWLIFGCGGNRDKGKRRKMGEIASIFSDTIIVTDDNPRIEDPYLIRKQILSGCNKKEAIEIPNREEAIHYSLKKAKKNDIILISGKGNEREQVFIDKVLPFNDKDKVISFLNHE